MSKHLEDFFDRGRVRIRFDPASVYVPTDASSGLQKWATSKESSLLCITGPASTHSLDPSAMSTLAAKIIDVVDTSKLPVISYFCERKRENPRQRLSPHASGTLALANALLRQSFELLSSEVVGNDMSAVEQLDGSLECFRQILNLLNAALDNGKPIVYCIIDGMQDIEDRTTIRLLEGLVQLLQRRSMPLSNGKLTFKVLITTSGRCRCLVRNLSRAQLVLADAPLRNNRLRGSQALQLSRVVASGSP